MNWFDSSFFFPEKEKRSKKESKARERQKGVTQTQNAVKPRPRFAVLFCDMDGRKK
ncbi:MAG: hypothetical protein J6J21_04435 [Clostridia bacterium]|nr:hypothetical protein [Clostridia bacterium]